MKKRGKRYRAEAEKVDRSKQYELEEAVTLIKQFGSTKFDATVEVALRLKIDPKKADQLIRGSLSLPNGIGQTRKVIVFADGDEAEVAKELGALEVGMAELAEKIQKGWTDFDVAIAVPRAMKVVGKLGKILGPQGKMPSPKSGTVTADVKTAVKEFMAGKIEFRNDATGILHAPVGKISFSDENLCGNVQAFLDHITAMRPQTVKGPFMVSAFLTASMSPSIPLALSQN